MLSKLVNFHFVRFLVACTLAKKGSWREEKLFVFFQSIIMIPYKKIRGFNRTPQFVEDQYDKIAGSYIHDNYYGDATRYCVVENEVREITTRENMILIRSEIREVLEAVEFSTVLEVGAGELTTLEDIYSHFGPNLQCYGVDLSFARLSAGFSEFVKRQGTSPIVAKANAVKLPFEDNSFDLVITRHTLEQIPLLLPQVLSEIIRVAKSHIVLFEPSYELGSWSQKLKMLNNDYVRGIPKALEEIGGVKTVQPYLMRNSANPLNHTACFRFEKINEGIEVKQGDPTRWICPSSGNRLTASAGYLYSRDAQIAYPVIEGIPVFDKAYSVRHRNDGPRNDA